MTQPLDIIKMALQSIGAVAPGEPIDATLTTQAFDMLNMMLDSASNDSFMVISTNEIVQTLSGGVTAVTIGTGGTINSQRPLTINSAFARVSAIDYPIRILNVEQYELIGLKQQSGPWPTALYYNSGSPLGIINFWPKPSTFEVHIFASLLFTQFATVNDTITFPQGYNMWMMWELAGLLIPAYGMASNQGLCSLVAMQISKAKGAIKGTNMQPQQTVRFDAGVLGGQVQDAGWIMNGGF